MVDKDELEDRKKFKNRVVWVIGLLWIIVSGVLFYLLFTALNPLGLLLILSLLTFVMHIAIGIPLKAPTILFRNAGIYPFAVLVFELLNEISLRWYYDNVYGNPLGFAIIFWLGLLFFYLFACGFANIVLKRVVGNEKLSQDPISSNSYYLKSTQRDAIELSRDYIQKLLLHSSSISTATKDESTWLKFNEDPNDYVLVFSPEKENEYEVNILSWRIEKDILCEADKAEYEVIVSIIDTLFQTWKRQNNIDEWRSETSPRHLDKSTRDLIREYTKPIEVSIQFSAIRRAGHFTIKALKDNKKEIAGIVLTAIVTFILSRLFG